MKSKERCDDVGPAPLDHGCSSLLDDENILGWRRNANPNLSCLAYGSQNKRNQQVSSQYERVEVGRSRHGGPCQESVRSGAFRSISSYVIVAVIELENSAAMQAKRVCS